MSVTVYYDAQAGDTLAYEILAEAWNELMLDGLIANRIGVPPFDAQSEVLYATSAEGDIVGVLTFKRGPRRANLELAYVEPSSRGRGVFKTLFSDLQARLYRDGIITIDVQVPEAGAGLKAFQSVGFATRSRVLELGMA